MGEHDGRLRHIEHAPLPVMRDMRAIDHHAEPIEFADNSAAEWRTDAARAFAWFTGRNDLSLPLVDIETGSCRDGLHRDRPNENRGGESVVSYLLSLAEMRQMARMTDRQRALPTMQAQGA